MMPKGWSFEEQNEYEDVGRKRDEMAEFNNRDSCTQQSRGRVELTDD